MAEAPNPSVVVSTAETPPLSPDPQIDLPHGKGLTVAEANAIARRSLARVILFAGTAHSGKTTLLASLYLLFQRQPFANYVFAGSETLVGFEERTFFAMIASGRAEATTERTVKTELLHLRVRQSDGLAPPRDVLLCDVSGEDFREAKDSTDGCRKLSIIGRADTFVLLVDGEKLADITTRQRAKNDALTLLRNCLDAEMLTASTHVDVLFTKWDIVLGSTSKQEIEEFTLQVQQTIRDQFLTRLARIRFQRIAAQPSSPNVALGFGLEDVFAAWVTDPPVPATSPEPEPSAEHNLREYDRFLTRNVDRAKTDASP